MQSTTTCTIEKAHCESCGARDPQTAEGYTACCNELVCLGGTRDRFALEDGDYRVVGTVRACCWAAIYAASDAGMIPAFESGHRDCNDPRCPAHRGGIR